MSKTMVSLKEREDRIKKELDQNGPYSHNIIALNLSMINRDYGQKAIDEVFDKFELESEGYSKS